MKHTMLLATFIFGLNCYSQTFQERFLQICEKGELTQSKAFLMEWEQAEPNNPEMFVGLFNYYYVLSKSEIGDPNFLGGYLISENDSIQINSLKKKIQESDSLFDISQEYLNKGISQNQDRLDMHLGRANTLFEKGYSDKFMSSLVSIVKRNHVNKGQWLWTDNEPSFKNEEEFINMIQGFLYQIMSSNAPDYEQIISISLLGLETYPNNAILCSNIGYCKQEFGENEAAITYYLKGLASKPNDIIIRFNIANAYTQIEQIDKAKQHYQFIVNNGDDNQIEIAKELLTKLQE